MFGRMAAIAIAAMIGFGVSTHAAGARGFHIPRDSGFRPNYAKRPGATLQIKPVLSLPSRAGSHWPHRPWQGPGNASHWPHYPGTHRPAGHYPVWTAGGTLPTTMVVSPVRPASPLASSFVGAPRASRSAPSTPGQCTCLVKEYTADNIAVFRDRCTNEIATNAAPQQTGEAASAGTPQQLRSGS